MHQHSDGLTPILLFSFSLFGFSFHFPSSHRDSAVHPFSLLLQDDVSLFLCSIPFVFLGTVLYLTGSHFLTWVDVYLSMPPPICFAISLGLAMLLEKRGMYLHLPHPSARAHYCQQTALSFTETSELTALHTQLVKLVSMDIKLGGTCSSIMSSDPFGVFLPSKNLNNTLRRADK